MADRPAPTGPTYPAFVPARVGVNGERDAVTGRRPGGLLGTKIAPPAVPGGFLRRQRLQHRLDDAVTGPVTVVTGPPGAGKTLAVASWAWTVIAARGAGSRPVAWLALDPDDNDPALFWGGVTAALRASGAVPDGSPSSGPAVEQGVTEHGLRLLRWALNDLTPGSVLVVDDFQVINDREVLASVAALLRHESPLRLVLISRADPVLPLHRLRVSGGLHEIRGADLAFDRREAEEFLRLNGHALPEPDVALLVQRTEGWAAGLRLAAMFLSRDPGPGRADQFAGNDRVVVEYLHGEVIGSQPARAREFLLRTCIPDRICGPLADALVGGGGGQQRLEELERTNTFITAVGSHRSWFRYHPLLRETLLHELRVQEPVLHTELHRRAARWFAAHDAPVQALRHAADAQDWVLLGELFVTTAAPRILSADRQAVNKTLTRIPDTALTGTAALMACAAARLDYADRSAEIPAVITRARRMLDTDHTPYRTATTAVIEAMGDRDRPAHR